MVRLLTDPTTQMHNQPDLEAQDEITGVRYIYKKFVENIVMVSAIDKEIFG